MYVREILKLLGFYFYIFTCSLFVPLAIAYYFEFIADPLDHPQPHSTISFLVTVLVSFAIGFICNFFGKRASGNFFRKEGLLAVVLIWLLTPAVAGLPFYLNKTLENPFQAYFEACSGFTTTGATTLQAKLFDPETGLEIPIERELSGALNTLYSYYGTIEPVRDPETGRILFEGINAVSKALLFWRSFTQWLGGGGIIVLFVAILPALGVGGKMLFQAEVPGPVKGSLTPRIKETAGHLWKIYLGISLTQMLLLSWFNPELSWIDVSTITFSTVSTGGFTANNGSIGAFSSPATDWICMTFMVMGGINFSLYFQALRGKFYRIYEPELFLYLLMILFFGGFCSWLIYHTPKILTSGIQEGVFSAGEAVRHGFFQLVSCMTTTGFNTVDYDLWPYSVQVLLLIVGFFGGMAGATAGGIKIIRLLMVFRIVQHKVESIFRPESVRQFRIGNLEVDSGASVMVLSYFGIIIAISVFSTFIFTMQGLDPETSLSLVTLLINNIGMGFRMAAPSESLAFLSDFGLALSSLLMVMGRLEFLAVLAILVPAFWKQTL